MLSSQFGQKMEIHRLPPQHAMRMHEDRMRALGETGILERGFTEPPEELMLVTLPGGQAPTPRRVKLLIAYMDEGGHPQAS